MQETCDLHTHSVFSDGTWTPEQLIAEAQRIGLSAIALTDHNTVAGLPSFLAAARGTNVLAIPGCEFSTDYHGTELHIVGLFLPEERFPEIQEYLRAYIVRKDQSNVQLAAALNAGGYAIDYEKIKASTPNGQVNRAMIAAELVRLGYVESVKAAFKKILGKNCGFYVPPRLFDPFETIRFIKSVGGAAVWAHPFLSTDEKTVRQFLPEAISCGLDGMETMYSTYDAETSLLAESVCREFGLKQSGGSDFHGTVKPDIQLGVGRGNLRIPAAFFQRLNQR